ncbi:MAG TPA: DinB family protein [Candidatus Angelobacter sp.]
MTQTMQSDQANFLLREVFLPALEREHPKTRAVIEAIPLTKGDYRPDPVSKTALELAWHIVAAERRFLEGIANGEIDFNPFHRPDSVKNSADMGRWYGEMFESVLPRLQKMSPEQLTKTMDFRGMFQSPAVTFFQLALNHAIHHRGQLSVYLRPMGAKVPAIYGESYDSAEARKASQAKTA